MHHIKKCVVVLRALRLLFLSLVYTTKLAERRGPRKSETISTQPSLTLLQRCDKMFLSQ